MANYTGMKQILSEFWKREKAANNAAYASKSSVDTLNAAEGVAGSVLNSIKNNAKNAYAGNAVVTNEEEIGAGNTFTLPAGATVTSVKKADRSAAVEETDYTVSGNTYTFPNGGWIEYTTPGKTIAQELSRIDAELAAKTGFQYVKLTGSELPTASAETMQKIYLLPKESPATGYKEWLTIYSESDGRYSWEEIGDTDIDLSGYSTTAQMQDYVANHAKDAVYSGETTIEDAIDDIDTRVSAMEAAEFGLTINGVAATVDQTGSDTHAAVSITAGDIPMSSSSAQTIADAISAAGQVDDVQVSTDGSTYTTVVSNKIAQIDLSDYATKSVDLTLADADFEDIFDEE